MEILLPPIASLFYSTVRYFALTGRKVIADSLIDSKYWKEGNAFKNINRKFESEIIKGISIR